MWFVGRWWSKPALAAVVAVVGGVALVSAWWIDGRVHDGSPLRNVALDSRLVGGMQPDELTDVIDTAVDRTAVAPVAIDLGDQMIQFSARDLGIGIDHEATRSALMAEGRNGSLWQQLRGWATHFDSRRVVEPVLAFDESVARETLRDHPLTLDRAPVHPSAVFDGETLVPVAGAPGRGIDINHIVENLAEGVHAGSYMEVAGAWQEVPSPIPESAASSLVGSLLDRAGSGIVVDVGGTIRWIPPKPLFSWLSTTTDSGDLDMEIDGQEALRYVETLFADVWRGDIDPSFEVVDNQPVFSNLGDRRSVCCSAEIVPLIEDVLLGDRVQPITAPLRAPTDDEGLLVARDLGVVELVGEFTTEHACCASRVTNIHRIADIIRGHVIPPGEQFSINDFVGRRTRDNGFVSAGVIQSGRFDDAVGGGISQFATTMFNAAFFAGLDLPDYQSHSIYISRYPYGREATVSFPAPDLVVENTTPYHVLIWTSYTDTSITVQMYSTPHASVDETGQTVGRLGACTRVETFRERTYPDGSVIEDSVIATYRPAEGLDCNGRPTPRP